jgi:hypothetical protein
MPVSLVDFTNVTSVHRVLSAHVAGELSFHGCGRNV